MEENEKKPWKPPETANLPDLVARTNKNWRWEIDGTPRFPERDWWKKEEPQTATEYERLAERMMLRNFAEPERTLEMIREGVRRCYPPSAKHADYGYGLGYRNPWLTKWQWAPPLQIKNPFTSMFEGEAETQTLLEELGEKEENNMEMSLNARKIKEVTIKCEDGKTYEGKVERIMGCPYDISSQELTVKISKQASGNYGIKEVIFQNPATIVFWTDGTKTVVNCMDNAEIKKKIVDGKEVTVRRARKCDTYSEEAGLAMAIVKKHFGNEGNYNNVFRKFIPGMAEREKAAKKAAKKAKKTEE